MMLVLTPEDLNRLSNGARDEILSFLSSHGSPSIEELDAVDGLIVMSPSQAREFVSTLAKPTLHRLAALLTGAGWTRMTDIENHLAQGDVPGETFGWEKVMGGLSRRSRNLFGELDESWIEWRERSSEGEEEPYAYAHWEFRVHETTRQNLIKALDARNIRVAA